MTFRSCRPAAWYLALTSLCVACAGAAAQALPSLLLEREPAAARTSLKTSVKRSRLATVNTAVLAEINAVEKEFSCRIKLLGPSEHLATVRKVETSDERYRILTGRIERDGKGQILLVTDGKYLAGSVQFEGRPPIQIAPKGNGVCEVNELAAPPVPLCGVLPESLRQRGTRRKTREGEFGVGMLRARDSVAPQASSTSREIELMMLYTTASRVIAGDVAAMEAQVRLSVEEANTALANSHTDVRFRVVHMGEVAYHGSGDLALDLERLWSAADPSMSEVRGWRDQYKADLVCLVVERWETSIGVGYFATGPDDGYSVVAMDYLTGYYCVAHELGHNLGCDHDRENATGGGAYPFSYGYRFDADGSTYRTVMAYYPGTIIPYYSSPEITINGMPVGIAEGAPDAADNARTIREIAASVDSYRGINLELTQPSEGEAFSGKEPIQLAAIVNSDEGPVVHVEFLDGESLVGEATAAPYRFAWRNPKPGRREISARTHIAGGGDVLSSAVVIGVSPLNDAFADRLALSGSNAVASAILYAATAEPGEPASVRSAGGSAWWTWTAPGDGLVHLSGSAPPTLKLLLAVFSGGALEQLGGVPANRVSNRDLLFHATAGEVYQICLAGSPSSEPASFYLTMQDPPANDSFANAQLIDFATGTIQGSTVAATSEEGEPPIGAYPLGHSVWFVWTPPFSGQAIVTLAGGGALADLAVLGGTNLAGLKVVADSTGARLGFRVAGQQSYFIAVDGGFQGFALSVTVVQAALNDNFVKRAAAGSYLTINPATASREPDEPLHGGNAGGHSLWWSWRAPANGAVSMRRQYNGATTLPDLSVAWYTGKALTNLARVASYDFTNRFQAPFLLPVKAGSNYAIALETESGPGQSVRLDFKAFLQNDTFNQRQNFGFGTTFIETTAGATAEAREPPHAGEPAAHSVWWSWIVPNALAAKTVAAILDSTGQAVPRLSIYSGNTLSNLVLVADNAGPGGPGPTVTFQPKAGARYSFAIDETSSSYNYSFALKSLSAPPNDNFADAQALLGQAQPFPGSTLGATLESDEPEHLPGADPGASASVWYTWKNAFDRDVTVLATGRRAGFGAMLALWPEPVVAVYQGTSLASLKRVRVGVGSASFRAAAAEYRIAIASLPAQAEDFNLGIYAVPTNDSFEHAAPLAASSSISPAQLRSATREPGEPNHAGQASGHSLWWSWTASDSGEYVWNNTADFFNVDVPPPSFVSAVYTGTNLQELAVVASNSWSGLIFSAEAGTRYSLALDLKDPRISSSTAQNAKFALNLSRFPKLLTPRLGLDQDLEFSVRGSPGQGLSVESSFDLIHWQPVLQLNISSSNYRYSEPGSLLVPRKFYRVHLLPNGGRGFNQ